MTTEQITTVLKNEHKKILRMQGCTSDDMNRGRIITLNRLAKSLGCEIYFGLKDEAPRYHVTVWHFKEGLSRELMGKAAWDGEFIGMENYIAVKTFNTMLGKPTAIMEDAFIKTQNINEGWDKQNPKRSTMVGDMMSTYNTMTHKETRYVVSPVGFSEVKEIGVQ